MGFIFSLLCFCLNASALDNFIKSQIIGVTLEGRRVYSISPSVTALNGIYRHFKTDCVNSMEFETLPCQNFEKNMMHCKIDT